MTRTELVEKKRFLEQEADFLDDLALNACKHSRKELLRTAARLRGQITAIDLMLANEA